MRSTLVEYLNRADLVLRAPTSRVPNMPATATTSATTSLSLRAWEKNCIIGLGPGSILFLGSVVPLLGLVCAMVPKLAVQSSAPIPVVFPPCTVGSARDSSGLERDT